MSLSRPLFRILAPVAGAAGLIVGSLSFASAHVTVTPSTTAAGAYSVATFSVGHGCDGSATTMLTFQIPHQLITVTPTVNPNWSIEKKLEKLDTPVDDGHGGHYSERVAQVVYTAKTPLPADFRDTFALSLQLPAQEGEKLVFPVIQTCQHGETAWTQTYEEGHDEPDSPAPFIVTTAKTSDAHGEHTRHAASEADGASDSRFDALGWTAVALGVLGLSLGSVVLIRSRHRS